MRLKIGFDPSKITADCEASPAFEAGGMTLVFWALYKKHFITSCSFRSALFELWEAWEEGVPYTDIDSFVQVTCDLGLHSYTYDKEYIAWAVKYWDYLNPNVRRKLTIVYDAPAIIEKEWDK